MTSPTVRNRLNRVERHLVSQFAKPHGPLGTVAGRIMSKRGSNVARSLWAVDLLQIESGHRVLELGPGPGIALAAAAARADTGVVVGVDHSATMLRQARRRNREAWAEGRVRLIEGRAEALPPDVGSFDRIHCINVWQFWTDQEVVIARLADHLVPGGVLGIGFQPRSRGATAADTDAAGRCLEDQLAVCGLVDVTRHGLDLEPTPATAVLGRRELG